MNLSPHFTLSEATQTNHRFELTPSADHIMNMRILAYAVLEPWRELIGPLKVTSWFRSPELNVAIKGSKSSQHLSGLAIDVVPVDSDKRTSMRLLYDMALAGLPVDQAIIYWNTNHIHVSTSLTSPRRQFLYKTKHEYRSWQPGVTNG